MKPRNLPWIRRWWQLLGRKSYPQARRLLICADAGGSNGTRPRAWKVHVQALADGLGMAVTVCHYPPGTPRTQSLKAPPGSPASVESEG